MIRISIRALEVENCGPWRGRHRFEFESDAVCVLVLPNEGGKSTLIRTLLGILWGDDVPAMNWFAPAGAPHRAAVFVERRVQFEGASDRVTFYRIERDFATGRVKASSQSGAGLWEEVFSGVHRPRGRTADATRWVEKHLPELWAPLTAEAFSNIAVLGQPAPGPLKGEFVQQLITGTGQATIKQALDRLVNRFRELSRHSARYGLTERDAQKPGQLDDLRREQDELRQNLERLAGQLDSAEQLRRRLANSEKRLAELTEKKSQLEKQMAHLEKIRQWRRELDRAIDEAERFARAHREFEDLETKLADVRQELTKNLGSWAEAAPHDLESGWRILEQFRQERTRLVPPDILRQREEEILREHREVASWPEDANDRIEQYTSCERRYDELSSRWRDLQQQLVQAQPRLDNRRRGIVCTLAGSLTGVTATLIVAAIAQLVFTSGLNLLGTGWALVAAALIGLVAGLGAGALTWRYYRPLWIPEEFPRLQAEQSKLQELLEQAEAEQEQAHRDLFFTQQRDSAWLGRMAEKHRNFLQAKQDLEKLRADQATLAASLSPEKLPLPVQEILKRVANDWSQAEAALRGALQLARQRELWAGQQQSILRSLGCRDEKELRAKAAEWTDRRQNIRREIDLLASQSAQAEQLASAEPVALEQFGQQLRTQLERTVGDLEELQNQRHLVERQLIQLESAMGNPGFCNLAEGELRLAKIGDQIEILEGRLKAIKHAHHLIQQAAEQYSQDHREVIAELINRLMGKWTENGSRDFLLDQQFRLRMILADREKHIKEVPLESLSQGAWDQLSLAARLAVLDRVASGIILPVFVDDGFLTWDAERRERLRKTLPQFLRNRQLILLTHDEEFASWGTRINHRQIDEGETVS